MNEKGTVYFFTGLSGAGKTTIGGVFHAHLKAKKPNVIWLDGDELRPVFCEDSGYTNEDRLKRARRIFRVCKMLSDQGCDVVVCSIAMISSVRMWNRENIANYKEVYIKVKPETLIYRDQKGLYSVGKNVVGIDLPFDEPDKPDIVLQNDGELTPDELVTQLEAELYPQERKAFSDTAYWNEYYNNQLASNEPSLFAQYVATMLSKGESIADMGCGNGRDSLYFASLGLDVLAIDAANLAIERLQSIAPNNARFICSDFAKYPPLLPHSLDHIYSRFTLHAIGEKQEFLFLKNAVSALKPGGKLFIETRGIQDTLYGKGENRGRNAFYYDRHYRRFIVMDELCEALKNCGFDILLSEEKTGFAPYGNEDPIVIRVVAQKPELNTPGSQI